MQGVKNNPYASCSLCPRDCRVDRLSGRRGFCGETDAVRLACATLHRGEEPPLVRGEGSGAVFFTGCTLGCRDCQNCQLSRSETGSAVTPDELADILLRLEESGASNINFVTGTHFAPSIVAALESARSDGLTLPVVWNTSGFESVPTLELLDEWVDVYLTDIKTLSPVLAKRETGRSDYPDVIRTALPLMLRNRDLTYRGDALVRGVVVRHLVLPDAFEESLDVVRWFGRTVGGRALFSLMTQYLNPRHPEARNGISAYEYAILTDVLEEAGIDEGFIQEPEEGAEWLPDFTRANPFPEGFSGMVWHWRDGFVSR